MAVIEILSFVATAQLRDLMTMHACALTDPVNYSIPYLIIIVKSLSNYVFNSIQ